MLCLALWEFGAYKMVDLDGLRGVYIDALIYEKSVNGNLFPLSHHFLIK
jgi:hypothetical protein